MGTTRTGNNSNSSASSSKTHGSFVCGESAAPLRAPFQVPCSEARPPLTGAIRTDALQDTCKLPTGERFDPVAKNRFRKSVLASRASSAHDVVLARIPW